MSTPMISVVMPVYNGEKYLNECIDSILNQTFSNFEFIIVNDASTDKTEEIILSYTDKRIVYVKNLKNLKISKTLNKGIQLAKGKYIARMDADDISLPNRFEKQLVFLEKNDDIGVVGSMWYCIDSKSKIFETVEHLPISSNECYFMAIVQGENSVGHPCVMFRANIIQNVGGYNKKYDTAEDIELWFRMILSGIKFNNLSDKLLKYRYHNSQTSSEQNKVQVLIHHKALAFFLSKQLQRKINIKEASLLREVNFSDNEIFNTNSSIVKMLSLKKDCLDVFFSKYTYSSKNKIKIILKNFNKNIFLYSLKKINKFFIYKKTFIYLNELSKQQEINFYYRISLLFKTHVFLTVFVMKYIVRIVKKK